MIERCTNKNKMKNKKYRTDCTLRVATWEYIYLCTLWSGFLPENIYIFMYSMIRFATWEYIYLCTLWAGLLPENIYIYVLYDQVCYLRIYIYVLYDQVFYLRIYIFMYSISRFAKDRKMRTDVNILETILISLKDN